MRTPACDPPDMLDCTCPDGIHCELHTIFGSAQTDPSPTAQSPATSTQGVLW